MTETNAVKVRETDAEGVLGHMTIGEIKQLITDSNLRDDEVLIISVRPPQDDEDDAGFSENDSTPETGVSDTDGDDEDDDDDSIHCTVREIAVVESIDEPGQRALILMVDMQAEYDESEDDDGEEEEDPATA